MAGQQTTMRRILARTDTKQQRIDELETLLRELLARTNPQAPHFKKITQVLYGPKG